MVCLLDDDPSVLKGLGRLLTAGGWHSQAFNDPEKFLLYASTHSTPLAILDIWMPLMGGLEVQSRLRKISPSTRVIIFTAEDDPHVRSRALTAGATAFLTKPFDGDEFLRAVQSALAGG